MFSLNVLELDIFDASGPAIRRATPADGLSGHRFGNGVVYIGRPCARLRSGNDAGLYNRAYITGIRCGLLLFGEDVQGTDSQEAGTAQELD